jgi:hypothetical protein
VGRLLQRLAVLLAFAGAFLVPALARAALIPTCDQRDQVSRMPVEWMPVATPPEPVVVCTGHDGGDPHTPGPAGHDGGAKEAHDPTDDLDDARVAGMCDARGATVIAPERILAVSDARIEAAPTCGSEDAAGIGPGPRHSPVAGVGPALADHAVLDSAGVVLPASCELAPPYLPVAGGPSPGFVRGIDHPPR